ncbi:MAG TPA: twin-arginine translocase TatA/TatE family subunit [Anaerolineales bacterium]|nr:twin-arginine translocase TatA/TatE family subunit [Anaerolineales bacterium]
MEILGIGAPELIFILLIVIIVLGPKDMQKTGKTVGRWLNQLKDSEGWKLVRDTSRELRTLPNKWMREANLEMWDSQQDLRRAMDPRAKPPAAPRRPGQSLSDEPQNSIQPPSVDSAGQASANDPEIPPDKND